MRFKRYIPKKLLLLLLVLLHNHSSLSLHGLRLLQLYWVRHRLTLLEHVSSCCGMLTPSLRSLSRRRLISHRNLLSDGDMLLLLLLLLNVLLI